MFPFFLRGKKIQARNFVARSFFFRLFFFFSFFFSLSHFSFLSPFCLRHVFWKQAHNLPHSNVIPLDPLSQHYQPLLPLISRIQSPQTGKCHHRALTNVKSMLKGAEQGHSLLKKKADALSIKFRQILFELDKVRSLSFLLASLQSNEQSSKLT